MLNPIVIIELFDLRNKPDQNVIDMITDEIEKTGVRVDECHNLDAKIVIECSSPKLGAINKDYGFKANYIINIDRMKQLYDTYASLLINESFGESYQYAGIVTSDFDEVTRYISLVNDDINRCVSKILVEVHAYNGVITEKVRNYSTISNYNRLSNEAKQLLSQLCAVYNDGDGQYVFDVGYINQIGSQSAVYELVKNEYLRFNNNEYVLNRTFADSIRSVSSEFNGK